MKHFVLKPAAALMFVAALLTGSAYAKTSPADAGGNPAAAKAKKKKSGVAGQVRFLPGSSETTSERNFRLKRECKGRVNAGACAGFTG